MDTITTTPEYTEWLDACRIAAAEYELALEQAVTAQQRGEHPEPPKAAFPEPPAAMRPAWATGVQVGTDGDEIVVHWTASEHERGVVETQLDRYDLVQLDDEASGMDDDLDRAHGAGVLLTIRRAQRETIEVRLEDLDDVIAALTAARDDLR